MDSVVIKDGGGLQRRLRRTALHPQKRQPSSWEGWRRGQKGNPPSWNHACFWIWQWKWQLAVSFYCWWLWRLLSAPHVGVMLLLLCPPSHQNHSASFDLTSESSSQGPDFWRARHTGRLDSVLQTSAPSPLSHTRWPYVLWWYVSVGNRRAFSQDCSFLVVGAGISYKINSNLKIPCA